MPLMIELLELVATVALVVPGLHFAFNAYARHRRPGWSETLERRRLAILTLLVCAVTALSVGNDALDGDSARLDRALLLFLHGHATAPVVRFFEIVTLTGSWKFLWPLTVLTATVLLVRGRRFEAWLVAGSMVTGAIAIYAIKATAQRARPSLWETETYWGSSFPSGHTLAVSAFAIAVVVCIVRSRPSWRIPAALIGLAWIGLVGLSRMVLGVHWPTDILVAGCLGAFIPLTFSVAHELRASPPTR